jgi:hypothetical protein
MIQHLISIIPDANITYAETAFIAKKLLEDSNFDVICLDHDLGGKAFVDSEDENTGYQVATYIATNKIPYGKCIIHSLNFPGAMRMYHLLKNCFYLPVIMWTKESIEYIIGDK